MPELAEVAYFAKKWGEAGIGHRVKSVEVHAEKRIFKNGSGPKLVEALSNHTLKSAQTHGKQMLFGFSGGRWLGIHLGMTGELSVESADYEAKKHDHLVLRQADKSLVFNDARLFGAVKLDLSENEPTWWKSLPPPVSSPDFTLEHLEKGLKRRAKTPLKSTLLDQEIFPGIGNWMADEVLWQARLSPHLTGGELKPLEIRRLREVLRAVCEISLETVGKDWSDPPAGWLFHERWATKERPCPQTGKPLVREDIGGRTTCWSPAWQTRPARMDYDVADYGAPKFNAEGKVKSPYGKKRAESK